mmetsp:Transcript_41083/g.106248  ORF Transcript_41083/g.106248 Transcript_41083/m.106248 type:complete len:544 (+) Transcript_41083:2217-3848(+)
MNASGQREVVMHAATLLEDPLCAKVRSAQRGRALRVDGHAGPLHAEAEAEAVGVDTRRGAGGAGHLRDHAEDRAAATQVDAAAGVHELLLVQARAVAGLVADLEDDALVRVHAAGLRRREREEAAVEQLQAVGEGAVPQVRLAMAPHLRVWVEVSADVPALHGDLRDEVGARQHAPVPGGQLPGRGEPARHAPHGAALLRVEHVVHLARPPLRQVAGGHAGQGLLLLDLLQPGDGPPLELLHDGDAAAGDGVLLARWRRVAHEARQQLRLGHREVLARHHVGAQHDDAPGHSGDLEGLRLLVEGLQLEGALDGAEAEDDHDLGPDEDVEPAGRVSLGELHRLLRGHACLVGHGVGALEVLEAKVREHVLDEGRGIGHRIVDDLQACTFDAPVRKLLDVGDPRGPLRTEQAVHDDLGGLGELVLLVELLEVCDRLLDGRLAQVRLHHAEASGPEVPRHRPPGRVRVVRGHLHIVHRGRRNQRHAAEARLGDPVFGACQPCRVGVECPSSAGGGVGALGLLGGAGRAHLARGGEEGRATPRHSSP